MPAGVDYSAFAVTCYGSYDPEYDGDLEIPDGTRTMCGVLRSTDNGETWDYDHRVSLAWDAHNPDCGYANGTQASEGTIVVTFYDMGE